MDKNEFSIDQFLKETTEKVERQILCEQLKAVGIPTFELYKSFVDAGFTKAQAMDLTKSLLLGMISGGNKKQ